MSANSATPITCVVIPFTGTVYTGPGVTDYANSLIPYSANDIPIRGTITEIKVEPGKLRVFVTRVSTELTLALTRYVIPRLPADESAFIAIQKRTLTLDDIVNVLHSIRLATQRLAEMQNSAEDVDSTTVPSYETSQSYNDRRRDLVVQLNEARIFMEALIEALNAI